MQGTPGSRKLDTAMLSSAAAAAAAYEQQGTRNKKDYVGQKPQKKELKK